MEKEKKILELYQQGKSDGFIAKEMNFKSGESIRQWRIKNNLPSHSYTSLYSFNREEANKLFEEGKTYTEIAKILNCKVITLNCYFLKKLGKLSSKQRSAKAIELTQEQKEIVFGGLLGDMSLQLSKKGTNPHGKVEQGIKQLEYLKFKHEKLKNISTHLIIDDRYDERFKEPNYKTCYFRLNSNPELHKFYKDFYEKGKKTIPKDLLLLTPLAIAIWFMDDGSKSKNTYTIATCSFNEEDIKRIINYLYINYDIECTIHKSNVIYIKNNSSKIFRNLILPYLCESMKYKVNVT